jgi:GTPase KRas protein
MREYFLEQGKGFVLMYSILDLTSFEFVPLLIEEINKYHPKLPPILICGSKCDLESERQVEIEQGKQLADEYKAKFYEISSKENINISSMFSEFAEDIFNSHQGLSSKRVNKKCCIS